MSFLLFNNLSVDAGIGGFKRTYTDVQQFDRNEGLNYEGSLYKELREWEFEMPWEDNQAKAIGIRSWMKGRGHYWTFERQDGATTRFNRFSAEGGIGFSGQTFAGTTRFTTQGTWGLQVPSALTASVTASFGNEGRYSISTWKKDIAGAWILCSNVYDGTSTYFYAGAAGTALTTSFAWATITAVSGYLSLTVAGKDTSGSSATAFYDKLWIVPYALTTPMLAARSTRAVTDPMEPPFPYVELKGDQLEDLTPIQVKCFVDMEEFEQAQHNGVQTIRQLKFHVIEK